MQSKLGLSLMIELNVVGFRENWAIPSAAWIQNILIERFILLTLGVSFGLAVSITTFYTEGRT